MPPPWDASTSNGDDARTRSPDRPGQHPPLVIVSERGRHSQASRRIVRAQAARASAAQSRETRARNREDRHRGSPQPSSESGTFRQQSHSRRIQPQSQSQAHPQSQSQSQPQHQPQHQLQSRPQLQPRMQSIEQSDQQGNRNQAQEGFPNAAQSSVAESSAVDTLKPLVNWITNVLQLTAASLAAAAAALVPGNEGLRLSTRDGPSSGMQEINVSGGLFGAKQLPIALPKGFAALRNRIKLSGQSLLLLSRSACFDYDSPGVMQRLNQLLFDIVMTTATSTLLGSVQPAHPIEEPLRIASACLAILSCQKTEGFASLQESKYQSGLEAAWQEAVQMDQEALKDAKSVEAAEAALWAMFIISVTCGSAAFFSKLMLGLLNDLRLASWAEVRSVLINFNYPVMTLDHHCKEFYDRLLAGQIAQGA